MIKTKRLVYKDFNIALNLQLELSNQALLQPMTKSLNLPSPLHVTGLLYLLTCCMYS